MKPLNARSGGSLVGKPSFSFGNRSYRALWTVAWCLLAAWTPPPLHRWRRLVLIAFGARIGKGGRVYGSARVWHPRNLTMGEYAVLGPRVNCYSMGQVTVGDKAVVSQGAQLCAGTHDISDPNFQLLTKPISVGAMAWIAADAFVGPGVVVGEGAVIGARSVLFGDADPWVVYVGNPAVRIKARVLRS